MSNNLDKNFYTNEQIDDLKKVFPNSKKLEELIECVKSTSNLYIPPTK